MESRENGRWVWMENPAARVPSASVDSVNRTLFRSITMQDSSHVVGPVQSDRAELFPLLWSRLCDRSIWWDTKTHGYAGRASDNVEVDMGDDPRTLERYLADYPLPTMW